jgi:predicted nucleotidyltransferase
MILYGSRARGEATVTSDYDIIAIRENGSFERDCRFFNNFYLDIFVYSDDNIKKPDASLIRMKDGIVLYQKDNIGEDLIKKVKEIFKAGPPVTPLWEKHEINTWVIKMLERAKRDDIEGNFRRHWLLHDLLECYFKLRDSWYLGPKESFRWLKINDSVTYSLFDAALKPMANLDTIEKLIAQIRKPEDTPAYF